MLKKSLSSFIVIFFVLCNTGCAYLQTESMMLSQKRNSITLIKSLTFMKITRTSTSPIIGLDGEEVHPKKDHLLEFTSSGSGAIVKHKDDVSFILTAAHVCRITHDQQIGSILPEYNSKDYEVIYSRFNMAYDIKGQSYLAIPIVWNRKYDVCMLATKRIEQPALSFSFRPPFPGQRIFYMGFPRAIGGGSFVPIFDGYYLGKKTLSRIPKKDVDGYSIPIAPGSSGSAVIDREGNVIGMLHSYYARFDNIGFSATHSQLEELFEKADEFWKDHKDKVMKELDKSE